MNSTTFIQPQFTVARVTDTRATAAAHWIVLASLVYQAVLCLIHTHVHAISTATVAAGEFVIFVACIAILCKRSGMAFAAFATGTISYLLLLALLRDQLDLKVFRDVMIPILFFELGRQNADDRRTERLIDASIVIVVFFALFEVFFLDVYSHIFNIYSYYVSQGNILPGAAWAKDSVLSLNGIRPEGIGRTILPDFLGNHRISSIFLEPVSLGNFAVIIACWALSKPGKEIRQTTALLLVSLFLIALSDSRYGLLAVSVLIVLRLLLPQKAEISLIILPVICVVAQLLIAFNFNVQYADNIIGRLSLGGHALLDTDTRMLFGLGGPDANLGDMGYPAMLIHAGLPLCMLLWVSFWLIRMRDRRGERLRAYFAVYVSLLLCVSGSSMFALKTAGLLWFLLGSCAGFSGERRCATELAPTVIPSLEGGHDY